MRAWPIVLDRSISAPPPYQRECPSSRRTSKNEGQGPVCMVVTFEIVDHCLDMRRVCVIGATHLPSRCGVSLSGANALYCYCAILPIIFSFHVGCNLQTLVRGCLAVPYKVFESMQFPGGFLLSKYPQNLRGASGSGLLDVSSLYSPGTNSSCKMVSSGMIAE
jgi:hypothetical protein